MKSKKEKDEEEERGPEGRGVGCSSLLCRSAGRSACCLHTSRLPMLQPRLVLCSSPTSGEVNLSTGGIVSKAVHCEPLRDVNGIELQGAEVEVLKRL